MADKLSDAFSDEDGLRVDVRARRERDDAIARDEAEFDRMVLDVQRRENGAMVMMFSGVPVSKDVAELLRQTRSFGKVARRFRKRPILKSSASLDISESRV